MQGNSASASNGWLFVVAAALFCAVVAVATFPPAGHLMSTRAATVGSAPDRPKKAAMVLGLPEPNLGKASSSLTANSQNSAALEPREGNIHSLRSKTDVVMLVIAAIVVCALAYFTALQRFTAVDNVGSYGGDSTVNLAQQTAALRNSLEATKTEPISKANLEKLHKLNKLVDEMEAFDLKRNDILSNQGKMTEAVGSPMVNGAGDVNGEAVTNPVVEAIKVDDSFVVNGAGDVNGEAVTNPVVEAIKVDDSFVKVDDGLNFQDPFTLTQDARRFAYDAVARAMNYLKSSAFSYKNESQG